MRRLGGRPSWLNKYAGRYFPLLRTALGGKKIALRGGVTRRPIFPSPRPPSLAAVTGGGVQGGGAGPAGPGGGVNPTSMAQNDTHVALIILTTQMWEGELLVEKTFAGQNLCSCAFGANIHSYTKQRARHGTPFLQPPPPSFGGRPCHPPPRRAIFRSPWVFENKWCASLAPGHWGNMLLMGGSGTVVPLLIRAASAPWRPSRTGAGNASPSHSFQGGDVSRVLTPTSDVGHGDTGSPGITTSGMRRFAIGFCFRV